MADEAPKVIEWRVPGPQGPPGGGSTRGAASYDAMRAISRASLQDGNVIILTDPLLTGPVVWDANSIATPRHGLVFVHGDGLPVGRFRRLLTYGDTIHASWLGIVGETEISPTGPDLGDRINTATADILAIGHCNLKLGDGFFHHDIRPVLRPGFRIWADCADRTTLVPLAYDAETGRGFNFEHPTWENEDIDISSGALGTPGIELCNIGFDGRYPQFPDYLTDPDGNPIDTPEDDWRPGGHLSNVTNGGVRPTVTLATTSAVVTGYIVENEFFVTEVTNGGIVSPVPLAAGDVPSDPNDDSALVNVSIINQKVMAPDGSAGGVGVYTVWCPHGMLNMSSRQVKINVGRVRIVGSTPGTLVTNRVGFWVKDEGDEGPGGVNTGRGIGCRITVGNPVAGGMPTPFIADPGKWYSENVTCEVIGGGAAPRTLFDIGRRNEDWNGLGPLISLIKCDAPKLHGLKFRNYGGACVTVQGTDSADIFNCHARNVGQGDFVSGLAWIGNYSTSTQPRFRQATNTTIHHCTGTDLKRLFVLNAGINTKILHFRVVGCYEAAIYCPDGALYTTIAHGYIERCRMKDLVSHPLELTDSCTVFDVTFVDNDGDIIAIAGTGVSLSHLRIIAASRAIRRRFHGFETFVEHSFYQTAAQPACWNAVRLRGAISINNGDPFSQFSVSSATTFKTAAGGERIWDCTKLQGRTLTFNLLINKNGSSVVFEGATYADIWLGNREYDQGARHANGIYEYICTTAGVSAATGGPTGTGAAIADGTCVWAYAASTWSTVVCDDGMVTQQSGGPLSMVVTGFNRLRARVSDYVGSYGQKSPTSIAYTPSNGNLVLVFSAAPGPKLYADVTLGSFSGSYSGLNGIWMVSAISVDGKTLTMRTKTGLAAGTPTGGVLLAASYPTITLQQDNVFTSGPQSVSISHVTLIDPEGYYDYLFEITGGGHGQIGAITADNVDLTQSPFTRPYNPDDAITYVASRAPLRLRDVQTVRAEGSKIWVQSFASTLTVGTPIDVMLGFRPTELEIKLRGSGLTTAEYNFADDANLGSGYSGTTRGTAADGSPVAIVNNRSGLGLHTAVSGSTSYSSLGQGSALQAEDANGNIVFSAACTGINARGISFVITQISADITVAAIGQP